MAQPHVFTRPIETPRFKAVAGMPVPAKLDTAHGRQFLRKTYGEDIIAALDYRQPDSFLALIAKDSDATVRDKYAALKSLADSQAKTIRDLERDNVQLKKRLARHEPGGGSS